MSRTHVLFPYPILCPSWVLFPHPIPVSHSHLLFLSQSSHLPAPCPKVSSISPQPPIPPHIPVSPPPGVKVKGKSTPKEQLKGPEVCTDPVTLANYAVGVNYLKDSPEVALKPDSEYPEWLFQIHLGPPKKLEEMDPDSLEYWRRLRKYNSWQRNKLKKSRKLAGSGRGKQKCCSVGLLLFLTPISSAWGSVCAELSAGGSGHTQHLEPEAAAVGQDGGLELAHQLAGRGGGGPAL
uniref:Large ribosomal subunit protein mL54 n=1 Tax=Chrysolophus pictus TaxID=9089 RepID=A0A8C3LF09_CHRPC